MREFYVTARKAFFFTRPGTKVSKIEFENLKMISLINKATFLVCSPKRVAGLVLAKSSTFFSDSSSSVDSTFLATLAHTKDVIRRLLSRQWEAEWAGSSKGSFTRLFFPTIRDANMIASNNLSSPLTQILTGHSLLNAHQHRFNFKLSPACLCGHPAETTEHFLFDCSLYTELRQSFRKASLSELALWPPSLASIPQSDALWSEFRRFINKTNRLLFYCNR